MQFTKAVKIVISLEGGLAEIPGDPGGITKYGISLRAHPELGRIGIKKLTKDQASKIYKKDYWNQVQTGKFPALVRLAFFDCAVNQGCKTASKIMQKTLNSTGQTKLKVDGIVGPQTIKAAAAIKNKKYLLEKFLWTRQSTYRKLKNYDRFGRIWERRLYRVAIES